MSWCYMQGDEEFGPVDEAQLRQLLDSGEVTAQTLVRRDDGLAQWRPLGSGSLLGQVLEDGTAFCVECLQGFNTTDMILYKGSYICATCKPLFFQRVKEGVALPRELAYAGFRIRFNARFLDGIILGLLNVAVSMIMGSTFLSSPDANVTLYAVSNGLSILFNLTYGTVFLGLFGATPGKMMFGLKVVRPDGGQITYKRALGRTLADYLSAMTLFIGYIMAAFDSQSRALHDRICDTRVIKK